jgi:hypothetical protein
MAGLRIIGHRGNVEVRNAYVRYAKWLRMHYEFPVRIPVYLSEKRRLTTLSEEIVTACFFYPFDKYTSPYIRIATGDYGELLAELGRDNALASMLCSLSHELVHYWQWIDTGTTTERGTALRARNMVAKYAYDVDRP